uniref:ABC transporter domain-containing protein n=1 Tax=Plectus sambesii TaxID=2011161 RepID=A0A914VWS2_9BILA
MGQLRALVWKNFQFVKRHPVITAFFYLMPILFSYRLYMLSPTARTFLSACDHDHVVLFPSPPDRIIGSLLCSTAPLGGQCIDSTYTPPYKKIGKWFKSDGSLSCQGNSTAVFMAAICSSDNKDTSERTRVIRHLLKGKIVFYPDSDAAKSILARMNTTLDLIGGLISRMHSSNSCFETLKNRLRPANDKASAITIAKEVSTAEKDSLWGVIEFKTLNTTGATVTIICESDRRSSLATLYLQSLLDSAIYHYFTGTPMPVAIEQKLLPDSCHLDPFPYDMAFNTVQSTIVFGIYVIIIYFTADMCSEKNNGLLELLFLNGAPRYKVKLSWIIFGGAMLLTVILPLSIFLKFGAGVIMQSVSFPLLLLLLVLFGAALLCLSLMVSSLMPSPEWANTFMSFSTLLAMYIPTWAQLLPDVGYTETGWIVRLTCLLHPTVATLVSIGYIFAGTKHGETIDLFAMHSPIANDKFGGFTEGVIILLCQCVVYLILSWYFDHTAPSKYGQKLSWLFPCQPSYWRGTITLERDAVPLVETSSADVEPLTEEKIAGISFVNLTKKFGKDKLAVSHLTVDFYENEVTAFLGHNGAGKSTAMSMLTGMLTPTSGTAEIDRKDIWSDMDGVRRSLGFCPQYDIIYHALTAQEHVRFYGALKGMQRSDVDEYAASVFKLLGMDQPDQLNTVGQKLSGGMKRKLSVALAFLGSPKVIILDEPTSAIDPFSRRAIWDLILRHKTKSTILLSTHNMEEANILADRIAIINGGVLRCFGSPMYLKSRYGDGFSLIIAHGPNFNISSLEDRLNTILPLSVVSSSQTETTCSIPLASARSPVMVDLFDLLEKEGKRLGITSFGISESTMEQVFLNVAADECAAEADELYEERHGSSADVHFEAAGGLRLWSAQALASLIKRIDVVRRNRLSFLFQVLNLLILTIILLVTILAKNSGDSASSIGEILNNKNEMLLTVWRSRYDYNSFFYEGLESEPFLKSVLRAGLGDRPQYPSETKCASTKQPDAIPLSNANYCGCDGCSTSKPDFRFTPFNSRDRLLFVDHWNISQFILNNQPDNLIGGFFVTNDSETHVLWSGMTQSGKKRTKAEEASFDMKSILLNVHTNLLLRTKNDEQSCKDAAPQITVYFEEASFSSNGLGSAQQIATGMLLATFSAVAFIMQTSNTLTFLTSERVTGCKQLQYSMGLNKVIYWVANIVWDGGVYVLSLLLMLALMTALQNIIQINVFFFFVVSLVFGVGMLLQTYILTFFFQKGSNAFNVNYISSPLLASFAVALEMVSLVWKLEALVTISTIFSVFPSYFLTACLVHGYFRQVQGLSPWSILPSRLIPCFIFNMLAIGLIALLENGASARLFCSAKNNKKHPKFVTPIERAKQDADVLAEEAALLESDDRYILAVDHLSKTYTAFNKPSKQAVKGVSFGVEKGVCFGLAGLNGAGKTTLFRMLMGGIAPTSGDALFKHTSIFANRASVAKQVAYCPQVNILFDDLTPKEHLRLYASIRGIPAEQRRSIIDYLIAEVGLTPHQKKIAKELSGGNKRKLNLALALLANPQLLFLDEMSTGMDPKARRAAWTRLQSAMALGCSAVLTSHDMEECEALCHRLTIMVNGELKCIGGIQYLKDKFGNNYSVKLRLAPGDAEVDRVRSLILNAYTNALIVEERPGFLEMKIASDGLRLSHLFALIHNVKQKHAVVDFSVTQTTLDHVFVNMVRNQS